METYEVTVINDNDEYVTEKIVATNPLECMRIAREFGDPVRMYYLGDLVWEKKHDA